MTEPSILIVDDDPSSVRILAHMLAAEARLAPTLRPTWSEARLERLRAAAEALEFEEALAVIDEARTR